MISACFHSIKKTIRLKRVSKKLAKPLDIAGSSSFSLVEFCSREDLYLNSLIAIAKSDEYVEYVIDKFRADDAVLKKMYVQLASGGAMRYVAGHYVAASSLVYPLPLIFLLKHFDGVKFQVNELDGYRSAGLISNSLISYFKNKERGEVKLL